MRRGHGFPYCRFMMLYLRKPKESVEILQTVREVSHIADGNINIQNPIDTIIRTNKN